MNEDEILKLKMDAAAQAISFVTSGMVLGLGTGSTAILAVRMLGKQLANGTLKNIIGIPTSLEIEAEANRLELPISTLEVHPEIELTIDGADEVDPNLDVIKGGGGALLREKIVAQASKRIIIIVDESKPSLQLGTKWAVPVEVIPFGWGAQFRYLESLGAKVHLRLVDKNDPQSKPFMTDHGNMILDCDFGPLSEPFRLAEKMNHRVGIVEHGLFLNMVTDVIIAGQNGLEHLTR